MFLRKALGIRPKRLLMQQSKGTDGSPLPASTSFVSSKKERAYETGAIHELGGASHRGARESSGFAEENPSEASSVRIESARSERGAGSRDGLGGATSTRTARRLSHDDSGDDPGANAVYRNCGGAGFTRGNTSQRG